MRRRDLIPLLLDQPRTLSQLARELRLTPRELADDFDHLFRSLRHSELVPEITPARCRKCDFRFGVEKLVKPAKCPQCHGTWVAEALVCLRHRPEGANAERRAVPSADSSDPTEQPVWLQSLDHTADAGIVVTAPDLPTLFSRAAWGMFSLITDLALVQPAQAEDVAVEADDLPGLLLRWLSELNYRHVTGHRVYARFDVTRLTNGEAQARAQADDADPAPIGGPYRLAAEVRGEAIIPERHTIYTEIKAVTFHDLEIARVDGGWRAQVIFDL